MTGQNSEERTKSVFLIIFWFFFILRYEKRSSIKAFSEVSSVSLTRRAGTVLKLLREWTGFCCMLLCSVNYYI